MDYVHPGKLVPITGVQVIDEYQLRLTFEDGLVGDVSFVDREWKGVFTPFRDPARFAEVYVDPDVHTLVWPNGLDMAPEPLYEKASQHQVRGPSTAAHAAGAP
jgi:hypothetical protein